MSNGLQTQTRHQSSHELDSSFGSNFNFNNNNHNNNNNWGSDDEQWRIPDFGERPAWVERLRTWISNPNNEFAKLLAIEMIHLALAEDPEIRVDVIRSNSLHLITHWQTRNYQFCESFYEFFWNTIKTKFFSSEIWKPLNTVPEQLPTILSLGDISKVIPYMLTAHHNYDLRAKLAGAELKHRIKHSKASYEQLCLDALRNAGYGITDNTKLIFGVTAGMDTLDITSMKAEVFVSVCEEYKWNPNDSMPKSWIWQTLAA